MIIPKYMRQFPNSLSLLKGSLSSKSYTCHYATSGSKYLIIMFDILMLLEHILVLSNIYMRSQMKNCSRKPVVYSLIMT